MILRVDNWNDKDDYNFRYIIVDTQFQKEISKKHNPEKEYSNRLELDIDKCNFLLSSIFNAYRETKQCATRNLVQYLSVMKPNFMSNEIIMATDFYKQNIRIFEKHYPIMLWSRYKNSFIHATTNFIPQVTITLPNVLTTTTTATTAMQTVARWYGPLR